jgi:hypothetical protein
MGKNIKYGEFTFAPSPARPTGRPVSTAKSTKGIPKAMYDAPHAMKDGGMCAPKAGYAKGGPKVRAKREPEAMVRKEVALLRKSGAPKALVSHEVREMSGEMDTPATKKAEVGMMRKAKAPLTMIKEEMMEPVGLKKGGMAGCYAEGGQFAAGTRSKMDAEGKAVNKMAKKFGTETQKYAKGGSVEAKLEKHANMPAAKAHGPGAGNKLAKGGVPTFSKVPKFGQMK